METEKYYGLNETTTIDSSNIDCKYSDQTEPVNPLLNTTTTISPIKNYKKLVDCASAPAFTLTKHNDAITDSSLQVREIKSLIDDKITYSYSISTGTEIILGTPKDVYLGYEDTNKIFEGNLSSVMTAYSATLDSDVTGCSAKLSRADTTGASIKYSLNKCTADRIITFSYNKLPIFSIKQIYDNSGNTKSWTIYVCSVSETNFTNNKGVAFFDTNQPIEFSMSTYGNQIEEFRPYHNNGQTTYVLMYTEDNKIIMNYSSTKIGTLLKNGNLKHSSGHDYLTKDKYKDLYLDRIVSVNHYENVVFGNGTLSKKDVTFDMNIYVYINQYNGYYQAPLNTFNFKNTESDNHLGVYELTSTT